MSRAAAHALLAALAVLGVAGALPAAAAAQDRFAGWDEIRDPSWRFDPDDRPVLGFSVPGSAGVRAAFAAVAEAFEERDLHAAARGLVDLATRHAGHVVQVAGGSPRERWVGAGEWALYQLATRIPAEVRAGLAGAEERAALERAVRWRDEDALRRLARQLEGLPEGARAAQLTARLAAERGAWSEARFAATRAAALPDAGDPTAAAALLAALPADAAAAGDAARREASASLPSSLAPDWAVALPIHDLYRLLDQRGLSDRPSGRAINPFLQYPHSHEAPIAPVVPVVDDGVVFVADSISVTALDLHSGREIWHHAGPLEVVTRSAVPTAWFDLGVYARTTRERAVAPYQYAAPAVTGELVLATVQVPEPRREHELREFERYPINWPLPKRRLVALDRRTGAVRWSQERAGLGPGAFENLFDVAGPPVVHGGVAFAAGSVTEGAINAYMAAFDLDTGALLWRTLLCSGQQELTMFNRPFQEHVVSPPTLADGDLFVSTNLGVVACVDAWSGRVRWLTGYEATPRAASMTPDGTRRRAVFWTNHPPVVAGEHLVVTPLDAQHLLVLERRTGRYARDPLESRRGRREFRHHVEPGPEGCYVIAGGESLECVEAASGDLRWSTPPEIGEDHPIVGPVALQAGRLYVPLAAGLLVVDAASGRPLDAVRPWEADGVRRVAPAGSVLVATDNAYLYAALDVRDELARVDATDASPAAKGLEKAELLLIDGSLEEAWVLFEAALASDDPRYVARARSGRLETALRLAERAGDPQRWERLLAVADEAGALREHARAAFTALESHDSAEADAITERWLAELAADDPHAVLELGPLTPEGPAPVGLVLAWRQLQGAGAAAQVDVLQRVIAVHPDARWAGGPAWEEAARRIDALLAEHGRQLYARYEEIARQAWELVSGTTEDSRLFVERRFPNAEVIARARHARLAERLEAGMAVEVFEELGTIVAGERHRDLRAAAARQLGEDAFAAVLAGEPVQRPPSALPRLPADGARVLVAPLHERYRVSFPRTTGQAAPAYARCALAIVNVAGRLVLLDTVTGQLRWERDLPGGLTYARERDIDFHLDGDRLLARCERTLTALDLLDGRALWSRGLAGTPLETVVVAGLLLVLTDEDGALHVTGYGATSGATALRVPVPECHDARLVLAGAQPTLFARGELGHALLRLDVIDGALRGRLEVPEELTTLVRALPGAPVVVLSGRVAGGSRVSGWDVAGGRMLWESVVDSHTVSDRNVWRTRAGGLVLVDPPIAPTERGVVVALAPLDAERGFGARTESSELLEPVSPARDDALERLVFAHPDAPGRLLLADPGTGAIDGVVELDPPPEGYLQVLGGADGFAVVSETPDPSTPVVLWVVRVGEVPQRYSIDVEALYGNGLSELALVDGAVVLARGGAAVAVSAGPGDARDEVR